MVKKVSKVPLRHIRLAEDAPCLSCFRMLLPVALPPNESLDENFEHHTGANAGVQHELDVAKKNHYRGHYV